MNALWTITRELVDTRHDGNFTPFPRHTILLNTFYIKDLKERNQHSFHKLVLHSLIVYTVTHKKPNIHR